MLELLLTAIIIAISLYGYIIYGLETKRKVLRPRAATWLIWAILGTCVAYLQLKHGAGLGAVVTVVAAVANYILAVMVWHYGRKNIHPIDIMSCLAAVGVVVLWATAADSVTMGFAALAYLSGFLPTFERAYRKPYDENIIPFVANMLKYSLSLFIIANINFETVVYPVVLALFNFVFLVMVVYRRRSVKKSPKKLLQKKERRAIVRSS